MTEGGERSIHPTGEDAHDDPEALRQRSGELCRSLASFDGHQHTTPHLALIYENRDEQFAAAIPFVQRGLERGEHCLYVADENSQEEILAALRDAGVDVEAALESGALQVLSPQETYLEDGTFDVDDSLTLLEEAVERGSREFDGFRVTVEETWLLAEDVTVEEFMELEARVNDLFEGEASKALCQYDRTRFPPDVIQDVIRTHPQLVHDDGINDNIYYTPPEEFLAAERPATDVDRKLRTLQERSKTKQDHKRVVEALEAAREGISLLDDDGIFIYVNDAYADTFGYEPDEMIGEHWNALGIESDPEYVMEEILPSVRREGQWNGTTTCVRSDDSTFVAQHSLTQTDDEEIICVLRDVTEHKQREEDLELFRQLVDQSNDAVLVIEPETGRILDINDTACRRLGYDRDELLELSVPDIDAELPTQEDWESFVDELRAEGAVNFDGTHVREDGSTFPVEVNVTHVELDQEYVLSIARDVTERRQRERELKRALDLLERTERIADVGGWEVDPETQDVFWTDHIFELLEVTDDEEPPLEEAIDMYHGDDQAVIENAVEEALECGECFEEEVRIRTESGAIRWLRVQGVPETADGDVVSLRGAIQDITERKHREQRLGELIERLQESNERLEHFAHAASHDLQEPLRMISTYLQLLEDRYESALDEEGQEYLEFAVDGADRMRAMIDGLLQYSRVETQGKPLEPVSLDAVLDDVLEDLQLQIEESDATIAVDDLPRVEGDGSQLRQVFQNLLENAIEYSGDEPPQIHVTAERDGDEWVVSVADEGIGIDPENTDQIFEVFERLHSRDEHSGTGIGLALCERIVERHGGDIWVDSEAGEGATFSFTLPAVE